MPFRDHLDTALERLRSSSPLVPGIGEEEALGEAEVMGEGGEGRRRRGGGEAEGLWEDADELEEDPEEDELEGEEDGLEEEEDELEEDEEELEEENERRSEEFGQGMLCCSRSKTF